MPDFSVSTAFTALDKTSKVLKSIGNTAKTVSGQMAGRFKSMSRSAVRVFKSAGAKISATLSKLERKTDILGGKFASAFKTGVVTAAVVGLTLAMGAGIRTGLEFEQTIVNAAAKFGPAVKPGTQAFIDMEAAAKKIGATTEFTSQMAASGLNFMALAGFNVEQSIASLPGVIDLATAAQIDLGRASDIATDTLGAMGLATKDSAQLSINLARVNDVLAKTTTTANTNMEQLFESIVEGGPVAIKAGGSLEQYAALAGKLANAGIKGSKAGTTLKNVFVRLAATTPLAEKTLKRLHVTTKTAKGDLRDVTKIFDDLNKATAKLGTADKAQVLNDIFGKIPIAGVNVLLAEGGDALRDYTNELLGAAGANKEMADLMRSTTSASVKILKSALEGLGLVIFEQIKPAFLSVVIGLTKFIGGWAKFIEMHPGIIKTLLVIGKIAVPVIAVTAAILSLNLAIAATNILMAANPVGLIVIGITAAIAVIVIFHKQILAIGAAIVGVLISPMLAFLKLLGMIPGFGALGNAADAIGNSLNKAIAGGFGLDKKSSDGDAKIKTPAIATANVLNESRSETTNKLLIEDGTGRARLTDDSGKDNISLVPSNADLDFGFGGA